jgi:hypothetical protein
MKPLLPQWRARGCQRRILLVIVEGTFGNILGVDENQADLVRVPFANQLLVHFPFFRGLQERGEHYRLP